MTSWFIRQELSGQLLSSSSTHRLLLLLFFVFYFHICDLCVENKITAVHASQRFGFFDDGENFKTTYIEIVFSIILYHYRGNDFLNVYLVMLLPMLRAKKKKAQEYGHTLTHLIRLSCRRSEFWHQIGCGTKTLVLSAPGGWECIGTHVDKSEIKEISNYYSPSNWPCTIYFNI